MADDSSPSDSPQNSPPEPVSPWVEAMRVLSQITTAVAVMLVCVGLGYGVDYLLDIRFFTLVGCAGGVYLGIRHLIEATR